MNWFTSLLTGDSIAHAVFTLAIVATVGLALGSLRIKGLGLGIAGVLFSGLLLGHLGLRINHHVLEFAREFGLILFVYTIGMQVGPGFFASLRKEGLPLNIMAASIVLLGAGVTVALVKFAGVPIQAAAGLFSGATTNTPSLGAVQEAIKSLPGATPEMLALPGLGYAVAYPFGIIGIILAMVLLRVAFRVNIQKESVELQAASGGAAKLQTLNLTIENHNLDGTRLSQMPGLASGGVVISRIKHGGQVSVAKPEDVLHVGDTILAVGSPGNLEELRLIVGKVTEDDLRKGAVHLVMRRIIVTHKEVLGKTIRELALLEKYGVSITRVSRAEVELSATAEQRLQFGDMVVVVGETEELDRVGVRLGNSLKQLNHTEMIPIFLGIALGVLFGSIPVVFPGIPAPVKLGLAGGPLITAILLSRMGRFGPLLWYMPINANVVVRELGIVLFLACVGLHSGERFVETLVHGDGLQWMALAALITIVPLLIVGFVARFFMKTNFISMCGLLAGSMTDPPALAFANTIAGSDGPSTSYATVYPLTMVLRVLCAQILVLLIH